MMQGALLALLASMAAGACGAPVFFDDFEYTVDRDTSGAKSVFLQHGWSDAKLLQDGETGARGYIYTVDSIGGSTDFPGVNSARVLAIEARPDIGGLQTDFYLQWGLSTGAIGQIPGDHWYQFWLYVEDTPERPSVFSKSQSKFLYPNRNNFYPATTANEGFVYIAAFQGTSKAPLHVDPCPSSPYTCDQAFFETGWEGVHGGITNNIEYEETRFGANLSTTPHMIQNGWVLIRMHYDLPNGVYEQWIRPLGGEWIKTTEYIHGVTIVNGAPISLIPRFTDGFRTLRMPSTVGSAGTQDDKYPYWVYLDDFVIASDVADLPNYDTPAATVPDDPSGGSLVMIKGPP